MYYERRLQHWNPCTSKQKVDIWIGILKLSGSDFYKISRGWIRINLKEGVRMTVDIETWLCGQCGCRFGVVIVTDDEIDMMRKPAGCVICLSTKIEKHEPIDL